jgi:glyoxylase-like metal-dependent hydrolase (beta-lactamase superfamily II)
MSTSTDWQPTLHRLPGGVIVAQRDWLSANHVLLHGQTGRIIIDTGYLSHARRTRACVEAAFGHLSLDLIVTTHCHSDHMGCNAYLQRWTQARIAIPQGEATLVEAWDEDGLWLEWADQQCERFSADQLLLCGETYSFGDLDWLAISGPGHNDATVMFYNATHKMLITADALWENGFGFVSPRAWDAGALSRTRQTLDLIASLDVAIVIPGHGAPFTTVRAALDVAYARLTALEADDARIGRQIGKTMFIYSILAKERLPMAEVPAYGQRVRALRSANDEFLKMQPHAYATWLIEQAVASGNVRIEGNDLVPA